jgi:predicted amidohydrolase
MWLSLGGLQIASANPEEKRMENSHLLIDNEGQVVSRYVKSHLYDVELDNVNTIKESDFSVPGDSLPSPIDTPIGMLGLSICYDLRFPELFRQLATSGASVFSIPAAFL